MHQKTKNQGLSRRAWIINFICLRGATCSLYHWFLNMIIARLQSAPHNYFVWSILEREMNSRPRRLSWLSSVTPWPTWAGTLLSRPAPAFSPTWRKCWPPMVTTSSDFSTLYMCPTVYKIALKCIHLLYKTVFIINFFPDLSVPHCIHENVMCHAYIYTLDILEVICSHAYLYVYTWICFYVHVLACVYV